MGVFMVVFLGRRMVEGWRLRGVMERHLEVDMDTYEDMLGEVSGIGCMDKGVTRSICGNAMR
jgi:hypothetical protein